MQPISYLVAATVVSVRRRTSVGALPQSRDDLKGLIEKTFSIGLSEAVFGSLIGALKSRQFVRIINDEYAGEIFTVVKTRMDRPNGEVADLLVKADWGGNDLLKRAFDNPKYWDAISKVSTPPDEPESDPVADVVVPSSDRIVTLSHNQVMEIEEKVDELLSEVIALNQIEGEPNLREIVLGQLRAGKQLIEAGTFKVYALECTMLEALRLLAKRYEREAMAALATSLMAIILKHIGLEA